MRAVVLIVAAACLVGCGPRQEGPAPADLTQAKAALERLKSSGSQVMGLALPTNLPAFAVLPPDGFVTAAGEGENGPRSGWVEYSTTLAPGAVAAFYEETLKSAGLGDIRRDSAGLTAAGPGGEAKVSIRALDGVGSEVRLSYS